jgi:predicted DNA-binding WGR domain protein
MARYYSLTITPSLFGDAAVVREWGRIGRPGRMRIDLYEKAEEAAAAHAAIERAKTRRGYRNVVGDTGCRGSSTRAHKKAGA